jgi:hypothetical protein
MNESEYVQTVSLGSLKFPCGECLVFRFRMFYVIIYFCS